MTKKRFAVTACTLLTLTAGSSAWAQQYARPDGTSTTGGWAAVNAATHHEAVDEITADNSDYIDSGLGNNSTVILTLSNVNDPGSYANNHIIRYYCQATVGSKPKGGEGCDVALYQGGTQIAATLNYTASRGSFGLLTYTIADASAITDYTNLEFRITSSALDVDESIQVSWVELELPAPAATAPSVTTIAATNVTSTGATLGGNVSSNGNDSLIDVGVYYSTTNGFAPPGEGIKFPMTIQPVPGDFTGLVSPLSQGVTYYYRAYATNTFGETIATNQRQFTTLDFPTLLADPTVANIQPTSATLGGRVTSDGGDTVTDCGVTWGTTSGAGPYTNSASAASCVVDNPFTVDTSSVGPLVTGTTYYFRSYATNSVGTVYSATEGNFKPVDTPTVTATLGARTDTTAVLGGDITDTGGDTITAVGIIWDIDSDPINGGTNVPMTVADPFSQTVTSLPAGANLWFVAYASNGAGPGHSSVVPFTTDPGAPTMDPTPTVANIVGDGAQLGGTMILDGGGANLDCGVEWATVSGGPYGSGQSFGPCAESTPFAVSVSGLTPGQRYYFRAYASSDAGSGFSNEGTFVPQDVPIVISAAELDVTHNSARLGGNVTSDEGSPVTERGIVWDINPSPEQSPSKTTVPMGSGTGQFSQTVSLPSGTTIYFEAYASNALGTAYSTDDRSFPTETEPTVQASGLVLEPFGHSVRVSWTRGNGDGSLVAVWQDPPNTIDAPVDTTNYIADPDYSAVPPPPETSTNSGNFVVYKGSNDTILVTGLELNTTYNVAVYEYAGTGATTDYIQTNPASGPVTTGDTPIHNYDNRVDCEQCHKHGTNRPRQDVLETKCKTCHDAGQLASNKREFSNHLLPTRNPDIDYVDCGMCHELHKSALTQTKSISFVDSIERVNKSFLRKNVTKYVPNAAEPAVLHNDQPKREDGNPSGYPAQPAVTPERAVEGGDATTARGYCQVCHTMTAYHRNNPSAGASTPADYGKAGFMQCHDGSTENTACAVEVDCGDCHEHNNNFVGVNNNLPCEQCHDQTQGIRPIITTQFDLANVVSSHIPNGTPTKPDCVVCHGDHSHDGFVYGVDTDDGTTKYTHPIAKQDTLATGASEVYAPHCLSCHDDGSADSLPASGSDQTQTSPFIGANQPPVISEAAWGDPAVDPVNAAGHNRPTAQFASGPVSCVGDGANGCHGSGHGTDELSLLAPITADASITTKRSRLCTNCHQPAGVSSIDVRSEFDPAIGSNWQATSGSGAQINQRHDIFDADRTWGVGGAIACADCHQPHVNNATAPVGNPATGAALDTYNAGGYLAGGDADPTFGAGSSDPDMISFCTACHAEDKDPGTAGVWEGAGQSVMSDSLLQIGGAGGTYESDFHGYAFGGTGGNGFLKPPYQVDTAYAPMQCTDCHGAHGSPNIFNLKSSITINGTVMSTGGWSTGKAGDIGFKVTTVYDLSEANGGTQDDHQWGAWCSFCHYMEAHGMQETKTCTSGHMHGGGKL